MKQFFVDDTGSLSMGRLVTFLLFLIATFILFWSLFKNEIAVNGDIIFKLYTISLGAKTFQSFAENINKNGQNQGQKNDMQR